MNDKIPKACRGEWLEVGSDGKSVYVPLTQNKRTLIDMSDWEKVAPYQWHILRNHRLKKHRAKLYVYGWINTPVRRKVLLHRFLMVEPKGLEIDHKDHDSLNNRRSNLRAATRSQNARNMRRNLDGSSRFLGVSRRRDCDRWQAQIKSDGYSIGLGLFKHEEDAAYAYDKMARLIHREYANLNFPKGYVA